MALAGNVQAAEIRSVGPDGEAAVDASTIELTDDQIAQIKEGGYTAAICLHYGGNDWSTSQQKGLEDTFGELNIETVMAKKPDILVSIPTDATATADAYKQAAAAGIKIVFMDQRADGLEAGKDYVSVVSADNYGNGYASGTVLGDALGGKGKVAMVYYDANFAPTNQRDEGEIASGNIAGGGAQMPYDQGVAEAKLAALALLGEETPSYVAVPAETVTHENVLEAYTDVYHVETPDWLKEAYVE